MKNVKIFQLVGVASSLFLTLIFIELVFPRIAEPLGIGHLQKKNIQQKLEHQNFSSNEELASRGAQKTELDWMQNDVMHPYLGFVRNYQNEEIYNNLGFLGEETIYKRSPDTVIVGVFGGSVAWYVYEDGREYLKQRLQTIPEFKGKKIQLVSVSLGGFKQPQQLLALNYLLSLGAEFDVIINIDGFNEAALPYSDNFEAGITPYFPRHWNLYSRKSVDPVAQEVISRMQKHLKNQQQWSKNFRQSWLKHSQIGLLVWYTFDNKMQLQSVNLNTELEQALKKQEQTFQVQGPQPPQSKDEVFQESLNVWKMSSLQMARLARANGIRYFQALQPNQYLPGSKTLTETEKKSAYIDTIEDDSMYLHAYKYKEGVEVVYPEMRKLGEELKKSEDLHFIDMTQIFVNTPQTIYVDPCCHYNTEGTNLLISGIVEQIRKEYSE
jgi:hypothetical protein